MEGETATHKDVGGTSKNITVVRKVNKLLDAELLDSLKVSLNELDVGGEKAANAFISEKRSVRRGLESRVLDLHAQFLERMTEVRRGFQRVVQEVNAIQNCCDELDAALNQERDSRETLLNSVGLLREELHLARAKEEQVKVFMEQYQLTPEEQNILRNGEINAAFLQALSHAKAIHDSCRTMLAAEHQQAAVEVMEAMYLIQISAAEKLLRYLLPLTSELLSQDNPHVSQFYIDALHAIHDKPSHWSKIVHEVSKVRRVSVLRQFFDVSAHTLNLRNSQDITRALGDLLAWLHQAIAEEADILSVFFPSDREAKSKQKETSSVEFSSTSNVSQLSVTKEVLLDQIFEGISKHLGEKLDGAVDSISQSHSGASSVALSRPEGMHSSALVQLYKLESMLRFYSETTMKLLGDRATLAVVLQGRRLNCLRIFFDALKLICGSLISADAITTDYSCPAAVNDMLLTLKNMMDSLAASTIAMSERETEFNPILGAVLDPLPAAIDAAFADVDSQVNALNPMEGKWVFRINILSHFRAALLPYSFTASRQSKLMGQLNAEIDSFVAHTSKLLCTRLGFTGVLSGEGEAENIQEGEETVSPVVVRATLHGFYSQIYAGLLQIPYLDLIQSFQIRESIRGQVTAAVCATYEQVYALAIKDPASLADAIIAKNTPAQVRVLLEADRR